MGCIAMTNFIERILICIIWISMTTVFANAQEREQISADNVGRLQSVQQIDYADFDADINIGWFVANEDATGFIVFDNDNNLYAVSDEGDRHRWTYVTDSENELFNVIDAVYYDDTLFILYVINNTYFVNSQQLDIDGVPVNLARGYDDNSLFVEVNLDDGDVVIYEYEIIPTTSELRLLGIIPYPLNDSDELAMRVGRIDLPIVIISYLQNESVQYFLPGLTLPDSIFEIENGPAVFGAVNPTELGSTHFAWVDPNSTYLNLLDFTSGENRIVAELDNLYAQYYLLSHDASLVIAVNVDFTPNVIAWDTNTGEHYDLGEYRQCERIPDKVELSADGTTLVIGCDTGLDLWRIVDEAEDE